MAERPFGPYTLVRQIAVGGMAEIHLAKTQGLAGFEKYCALKMIHPNFAQDEQFIEMLIDEAKIAVQLQHVNIAHTFDLGRVGDIYYITMEFVDGADLYQILRKGSERDLEMPVDVAAFVAKEMANGLDYAHRKRGPDGQPLGIVHRDVSPQNVLVSTAGEVKLVDFGIAKATMKVRQTAVGVIKGKYYYMSPEQAMGERLDHRSDIFSAGIVLYEMLTSQMLYLEEDIPRLLEMVRRADIAPVRTLRKDVPPQLERILMRALAKRAADRYPSAGELAADLERFLHAYSPVFTSNKLAAHLQKAVGVEEELEIKIEQAPVAPAPGRRARSDSALKRNTLVTQRSELSDENSVIFRVAELKGAPRPRLAAHPPPRRPPADPHAAKAPPRMISASTLQIGEGDAETTTVNATAHPDGEDEVATAYDGPRGVKKAGAAPARNLDADFGEFEPTFVDQAPSHPDSHSLEEEGPTQTREAVRRPGPALPPPAPTAPRKPRPDAPAALAAKTPTPAVSELRRPRESRRTPSGGVPATTPAPARAHPQPVTQPSVLQSLVGGPTAPMPRARGAGAPLSDGVPSTVTEAAQTNAPTGAAGGRGGVPGRPLPDLGPGGSLDPAFDVETQPGAPMPGSLPPYVPPSLPAPAILTPPPMPSLPNPIPQAYPAVGSLPAHLMPYAMSPGESYPGAYDPQHAPPQAQPFPGYAPYGMPPATLSRQLAALEVDEMPAQYRLGGDGQRWLVRVLLAIILVGAGVVAAVLIIKSQRSAPAAASVVIDSQPSNAIVAIDGVPLDDRTPVVWKSKPGARHEIDVTLPGHTPFHDAVLIPAAGGEVKVLAFLPAVTVKLRITTAPPGADVYLNGSLKGRTPLELSGLAPDAATDLEVRLKDHAPERRALAWDGRTEQAVDLKLRR